MSTFSYVYWHSNWMQDKIKLSSKNLHWFCATSNPSGGSLICLALKPLPGIPQQHKVAMLEQAWNLKTVCWWSVGNQFLTACTAGWISTRWATQRSKKGGFYMHALIEWNLENQTIPRIFKGKYQDFSGNSQKKMKIWTCSYQMKLGKPSNS